VQHSETFADLVASLELQVTAHCGLTIEHCMTRDCETILVVPHAGSTGDHVDQPRDTDTTSVTITPCTNCVSGISKVKNKLNSPSAWQHLIANFSNCQNWRRHIAMLSRMTTC